MPIAQSRRCFLTNLAFNGAVGLGGASVASLGGGRKSLVAEPPPEVITMMRTGDGGATGSASEQRELEP